jgi:hypothetical protein
MNTKEELLDYIIAVLEVADASELDNKLVMDDWITTSPETVEHFCGYAACICGYLALDFAKGDATILEIKGESEHINEAMTKVLGGALTDSIVGTCAYDRWESAADTRLFSIEEMEHPHLTGESSLGCAISYLKLIKSKV